MQGATIKQINRLNPPQKRYTVNPDGTIEKWYLEKDMEERIALRKTKQPKFNCGLKIFNADEVKFIVTGETKGN